MRAQQPEQSEGIRRSQSQNQINLPSQDLVGLSLHPIDPIDGSPTTDKPSADPADPVKPDNSTSDSAFNQAPFQADFSRNAPLMNSTLLPLDTSTTSKGDEAIVFRLSQESFCLVSATRQS